MRLTSVAIVILTYRRPEFLERTIRSAIMQKGSLSEILVVDNASDDELRCWVRTTFPGVKYIANSHNGGCDGRNLGFRSTRAPIVISLDDDVELAGDDCCDRALEEFNRKSTLACLNFKIVGPDGLLLNRDWCHPRPISDALNHFETYFILEGECAVRRETVLQAGAYYAPMFLYHEGLDLAYRLINRGYIIEYTPEITVIHHVAPYSGRAERYYFCAVRNGLWIAYRHLPPAAALADALGHAAKMTFFALRAGQMRAHIRGCVAAVRTLPALSRQPLSKTAMQRVRAIRRHRPSFAKRIQRHLGERVI
jgi:GT2 family glycosyltransferase